MVAWLHTKMLYPRTVTHPSTKRARRRATTWISANALPLSQTATTYGTARRYIPAYWRRGIITVDRLKYQECTRLLVLKDSNTTPIEPQNPNANSKLMLAKSPAGMPTEKLEVIVPVFFELSCKQ